MKTISLKSTQRTQFIDITSQVAGAVRDAKIQSGFCVVFCPHTTAAITINENADPDVVTDMTMGLGLMAPESLAYRHNEGNSDAHIKSSLVGCSEHVIVESGELVLGTWQGIYFCEFDGPRSRQVHIKVVG